MNDAEAAPTPGRWWTWAFVRALFAALLIWGAYWLAITVLQWNVASLPGSTPTTVGVLYFIQLSPMLLLTPFAGPTLDRLGGRPLLLAAATLIVLATVAGAWFAHEEILLFALSAVLSACLGLSMAIGSPAVHTVVPTTVRFRVDQAVRQVAVAQNVARFLGPMLAGFLLLAVGIAPTLAVTAAIALGAVALLLRKPALPRALQEARSPAKSASGGILSGFRVAVRSPFVLRALLLTLANSVLSLSHVAMLPVIAADVLRVGEGGYAVMMSAGGVGAMVGALFPLTKMRTFTPVSVLLVLSAGGLILLACAPTLTIAAGATALLAALGVMVAISLNIHLQTGIAHAVRGRVMSLFTWCWGGFLPVGGLALGFVATAFGTGIALIAAGSLLIVVAVANLARVSEPSDGDGPER